MIKMQCPQCGRFMKTIRLKEVVCDGIHPYYLIYKCSKCGEFKGSDPRIDEDVAFMLDHDQQEREAYKEEMQIHSE